MSGQELAMMALGLAFFTMMLWAYLTGRPTVITNNYDAQGDLTYTDGFRDGVEFARQSVFVEPAAVASAYGSGVRAGRKQERERAQ